MKIPLNMGNMHAQNNKSAHVSSIEKDVGAIQKGDWKAKDSLSKTFMPLLTQYAEKRSSDPKEIATLIELGKGGIEKAAKKFKMGPGANFQIFVVNFIEEAMDKKGGGFFSKLFGGG